MEETSEENMLKVHAFFLLEIDLILTDLLLARTSTLLLRDQNLSLSLSLAFDSYNSTAAAPNVIR